MAWRARTANPARIHRVRAGRASRGVTTPVPRVYLPVLLTAPAPSGSPGTTRLCRGCSRPPRRPADQAASSFTPPLRRQGDKGLPPPSGTDSASWRTTSNSAFFARSPRTTRTARPNSQRISRQTILSSTWSANPHHTSHAGETGRSATRSSFRAAQDQRGQYRPVGLIWWRRIKVSAVFHISSRRDSRNPAATGVVTRNTSRMHMIGDHHGRTAGRATLLARAADEILGTQSTVSGRSQA